MALLGALVTDAGDRQVVNLRNAGIAAVPGSDDAVIEVLARGRRGRPAAVPVAPVSPLMRGLIAHVSAYEELAVDAALRGGRDRVAGALLAHPLVGQFDLVGQLADRLIAENSAWPAGRGLRAGNFDAARCPGRRRRQQQD